MNDPVLSAFLTRQYEEGMALARESDILDLEPFPLRGASASICSGPPDRYLATLRSKGLVIDEANQVREAGLFKIGIHFPEDYLRRVEPFRVLTLLFPWNVFHPNVSPCGPFICAGRIGPGTGLVELAYQSFEIFSYQRVTMKEDDALNPAACAWARKNQHRFPIDPRPLKRRAVDFEFEPVEGRGGR